MEVMGFSDPATARTRPQLQQVAALLKEAVCSAVITLPGRAEAPPLQWRFWALEMAQGGTMGRVQGTDGLPVHTTENR